MLRHTYIQRLLESKAGKKILLFIGITANLALLGYFKYANFFVENLNEFNLEEIGPDIENHTYFPQKCNVTIANVQNKKHVKIKVWERGAGLTKACGTAACATAVSGSILNLTERNLNVEFSKGLLNIDWKKDNNINMTGEVSEIKKIIINI